MRGIGMNPKKMCEIAKVSRSGYYKWLKDIDERPKDYDDYLLVKEAFDKGKSKWGWRNIKMELDDRGITMNHKKIVRIKNKYNLVTKIRRRNPYREIFKKTIEHRTFRNVLNRNFKQDSPRKVFCSDITYLSFSGNMAYLSAVKDIASREIVAWNLSRHLQMDLVSETIKNMENNKDVPSLKDVLMHSDQGFHYTSPGYVSKIKDLDMVQSMSR
ncbi:MAG: IS3 family transposase, partial [Patescibacteria group bacterium]